MLQALDQLGIDEKLAADFGIRLLKLACTWPVEPDGVRHFAERLEKIIVVEEKRGLVEGQVKEILYGTRNAPTIVGKNDEENNGSSPPGVRSTPTRSRSSSGAASCDTRTTRVAAG